MHVVFGAYEGPIDAKPGEKVVFIGDCAEWKGKIDGKLVADPERVQGPLDEGSAHRAQPRHLREARRRQEQAQRRRDPIRGLPGQRRRAGARARHDRRTEESVLRSRRQALTFGRAYFGWKARVTMNKLQRKRYQQNGTFAQRGEAAPELES